MKSTKSSVFLNKYSKPILLLLPFVAVIVLVVIAIINIFIQSLGYIPAFGLYDVSLKYYFEILNKPEVVQSIWVSLKISIISSIIAAIIGTVICAALVYLKKTKSSLMYFIRTPILVPHTVVAVFTISLLSQMGLLSRIAYSLGFISDYSDFPSILFGSGYTGVIIAYIWKEAPFIAYFSIALMSSISTTLGEAAENIGASPLQSFFHVTLPLSIPSIAKGFIIVFIFSFGGYELPLLLGATIPKAFPVYTYIEYIKPDLKLRPYAMAMNGVTLLLSLIFALIYVVAMNKVMKKIGGVYEK